jgi:hypothetical protein
LSVRGAPTVRSCREGVLWREAPPRAKRALEKKIAF